MAEVTSGKPLRRAAIADMLAKNFDRLPELDRKFFAYGPLYLGGNGALAGLVANSLYRRALNVTRAAAASSLPMAALPFISTVALYNAAVSAPLLAGDLNCPTCAVLRGALVGVVGGGVYPVLLALPVNMGLAARYGTTPMPEGGGGGALRFGVEVSRPVLRRMRAVLVLQAVFGSYLGNRHFEAYTRLAKITFSPGEELRDD